MRLPGVTRGGVEGAGARGPAVTVCSGRLRVRRGVGRGGIGGPGVGGGSGGGRRGSGAPAPAGRPAWWDGVSHVVTRPGSRARHLTREHVT